MPDSDPDHADRLVGGYTDASTAGAIRRLLASYPEHTPVLFGGAGDGYWITLEAKRGPHGKLYLDVSLSAPLSPDQQL